MTYDDFDENDVSAVHVPDLQLPDIIGRYTEQQIEEHCKDLDRCIKLISAKPETSYMPKSLHMLRQLQKQTDRIVR